MISFYRPSSTSTIYRQWVDESRSHQTTDQASFFSKNTNGEKVALLHRTSVELIILLHGIVYTIRIAAIWPARSSFGEGHVLTATDTRLILVEELVKEDARYIWIIKLKLRSLYKVVDVDGS